MNCSRWDFSSLCVVVKQTLNHFSFAFYLLIYANTSQFGASYDISQPEQRVTFCHCARARGGGGVAHYKHSLCNGLQKNERITSPLTVKNDYRILVLIKFNFSSDPLHHELSLRCFGLHNVETWQKKL